MLKCSSFLTLLLCFVSQPVFCYVVAFDQSLALPDLVFETMQQHLGCQLQPLGYLDLQEDGLADHFSFLETDLLLGGTENDLFVDRFTRLAVLQQVAVLQFYFAKQNEIEIGLLLTSFIEQTTFQRDDPADFEQTKIGCFVVTMEERIKRRQIP